MASGPARPRPAIPHHPLISAAMKARPGRTISSWRPMCGSRARQTMKPAHAIRGASRVLPGKTSHRRSRRRKQPQEIRRRIRLPRRRAIAILPWTPLGPANRAPCMEGSLPCPPGPAGNPGEKATVAGGAEDGRCGTRIRGACPRNGGTGQAHRATETVRWPYLSDHVFFELMAPYMIESSVAGATGGPVRCGRAYCRPSGSISVPCRRPIPPHCFVSSSAFQACKLRLLCRRSVRPTRTEAVAQPAASTRRSAPGRRSRFPPLRATPLRRRSRKARRGPCRLRPCAHLAAAHGRQDRAGHDRRGI